MFSKEKIVIPYTVEKCDSCQIICKRKFKQGDYLFSKTEKCTSCNGIMNIEKIFGEPLEK